MRHSFSGTDMPALPTASTFPEISSHMLHHHASMGDLASASPVTLVVNGVEGDKLSMTLTAVRLGSDGLIEKKTNFFFDVSEDHVAEDAQGLVLANQPDFDLDLELVQRKREKKRKKTVLFTSFSGYEAVGPSCEREDAFDECGQKIALGSVSGYSCKSAPGCRPVFAECSINNNNNIWK
jgi:hypothetical protein